jgi:hypothetical protein
MTKSLREVALPTIASIGLLVIGIAIIIGEMLFLYGMVIVVAALLVTGSWNAWLILMEIGTPTK